MMKKSVLQIGLALNKAQQKHVFGGEQGPGGGCAAYPTYPSTSPGGHTNQTCSTAADCLPNIHGGPISCDFGCCLYAICP